MELAELAFWVMVAAVVGAMAGAIWAGYKRRKEVPKKPLAVFSDEYYRVLECTRRCKESEREKGSTLSSQDLFHKCFDECASKMQITPETKDFILGVVDVVEKA